MSSIDAALIEYYTKYPELIINSYDWEIIITCARCGGVIPNKHPCITTEIAIRDVEYGKYAARCPHCSVTTEFRLSKDSFIKVDRCPIPHKISKRRKHVVSKKKSGLIFKKLVDDRYFYEYETVVK